MSIDVNFSFDNKALAPLIKKVEAPGFKKTHDYINLTLANCGKVFRNQFQTFFSFLTNDEVSLDTDILTISLKGQSPRLYIPSLYSDMENQTLVIKVGRQVFPISLQDGLVKTPVEVGNLDIYFEFTKATIGRYDEDVLMLNIEQGEGEDDLNFPIAIRKKDWKAELDTQAINKALRKGDIDALLNVFQPLPEIKEGSGSGNILTAKDLPQGVDLKVIGAKPIKTQYGGNYILTIQANPEVGLETDVQVFAFGNIKYDLNNGGTVSKENPGTLNFTIYLNEQGNTRYNLSFIPYYEFSDEDVDISDILTNW